MEQGGAGEAGEVVAHVWGEEMNSLEIYGDLKVDELWDFFFEQFKPEYGAVLDVLGRAYRQAAFGKGKLRHGGEQDIPFEDQRMMTIGKQTGPMGLAFQVSKKILEGCDKEDKEDVLGAIIYACGIYLLLEEKKKAQRVEQ